MRRHNSTHNTLLSLPQAGLWLLHPGLALPNKEVVSWVFPQAVLSEALFPQGDVIAFDPHNHQVGKSGLWGNPHFAEENWSTGWVTCPQFLSHPAVAVLVPTEPQNPAQCIMGKVNNFKFSYFSCLSFCCPQILWGEIQMCCWKREQRREDELPSFSFPTLLPHGKINLYCFRTSLSALNPFYKRFFIVCYRLETGNLLVKNLQFFSKLFTTVIKSPALNSDGSRFTP